MDKIEKPKVEKPEPHKEVERPPFEKALLKLLDKCREKNPMWDCPLRKMLKGD